MELGEVSNLNHDDNFLFAIMLLQVIFLLLLSTITFLPVTSLLLLFTVAFLRVTMLFFACKMTELAEMVPFPSQRDEGGYKLRTGEGRF